MLQIFSFLLIKSLSQQSFLLSNHPRMKLHTHIHSTPQQKQLRSIQFTYSIIFRTDALVFFSFIDQILIPEVIPSLESPKNETSRPYTQYATRETIEKHIVHLLNYIQDLCFVFSPLLIKSLSQKSFLLGNHPRKKLHTHIHSTPQQKILRSIQCTYSIIFRTYALFFLLYLSNLYPRSHSFSRITRRMKLHTHIHCTPQQKLLRSIQCTYSIIFRTDALVFFSFF